MNSHFHTFTTSFFNDNIFCPRCLSYIAIGDIENHSNQHERSNFVNTVLNLHQNTSPYERILQPRIRNRPPFDNPVYRLARLQSLYRLSSPNVYAGEEVGEEDDSQYEFNIYIANLLGDVEVGVTDINRISHLVDESAPEYTKCECHICLEPTTKPRKLLCNHVYCDDCITTWLSKNKTCPVCRKDLEELETLKEAEKIED